MTSLKKKYLSKIHLGNNSGFTLVELMIGIGIIGIVAATTAPVMIAWLPNYRLKSAARDLDSTFQYARMLAVKRNVTARVILDNTVTPGFYYIDIDGSNDVNQPGEYRTDLGSYGDGIDFGSPAGLLDWNAAAVGNSVAYTGGPPRFCTYNPNGTSGSGTVYLMNNEAHIVYAISTVASGAVKQRKYSGIKPFNQKYWIE